MAPLPPSLENELEDRASRARTALPTKLPDRSAVAIPDSSSAAPTLPSLEGYQVLDKLGAGGMGTVWRATQLSTRRDVAVKLLNFGLATSDKAKQRFDREVEITSQLQHPHIARIYDSGVLHGTYFFAMELINGVPLDQYVNAHKMSRVERLRMMLIVCEAVQHAHQKGVIHRDLKPSNILVTDDGQPHLLDFGLGKYWQTEPEPLDSNSSSKSRNREITIEGEWAGTPAYMSPEQASGHVHHLDTRSDVYSLGVILYELLTSKLPHDTHGTHAEVLFRIIEKDIIPPRKAANDVDAELEAMLFKALAKSPDDRYPSAEALRADISNYLQGEPLSARPLTAFYFFRRKIRKHRLLVAAICAVIAILTYVLVHSSLRIRHERDLAAAAARAEKASRDLTELRLADYLLLWGNSLTDDRKYVDAQKRFWEARDLYSAHQVIPVAANIALHESYRFCPTPILQFDTPTSDGYAASRKSPSRSVVIPSLFRMGYVDLTGRLHWHDLMAGREISVVGSSENKTVASAISSDGKSFVRCINRSDANTSVRQYVVERCNAETGDLQNQFQISQALHGRPVFSASGRFMVCAVRFSPPASEIDNEFVGEPGQIALFDVTDPSGKPLMTVDVERIHDHGELAVADDGSRLITAGQSLSLWNTKTRQQSSVNLDTRLFNGKIDITPDGQQAFVTDSAGTLRIIDLHTAQFVREFDLAKGLPSCVAFSAAGKQFLITDLSGQIHLFDFKSGTPRHVFTGESDNAVVADFSPDGRLIVARNAKGRIWIWNIGDQRAHVVSKHKDMVSALAMSADGRLAAIGHWDRTLLINDVATGRTLLEFKLDAAVDQLGFSPDLATIVAADVDGSVYRIDLRNGKTIKDFTQVRPIRVGEAPPTVRSNPTSTVFSPSVQQSIGFSIKGAVLWEVESGKKLRLLDDRPVSAAAFSADGKRVFLAIIDGKHYLKSIELDTGKSQESEIEKFEGVSELCCTPDGKSVAIGHHSGVIQLIDLQTRKTIWESREHLNSIHSMSMTNDGRTILSASNLGVLVVLDAANGRRVQAKKVGTRSRAAAMIGDGSRILYAADDGKSCHLWDFRQLVDYRQPQDALRKAWSMLRETPNDSASAQVCARWYAGLGRFDWANHILAQGINPSASAGIISAQSHWLTGDGTRAAQVYADLGKRTTDIEIQQYLALCEFAATQEQKK